MRRSTLLGTLGVSILAALAGPAVAEEVAAPAASTDEPTNVLVREDDPDVHDDSSPPVADEHDTHTPIAPTADYDEIVITATPHPRRRFDVIQGTTVLGHEALEQALRPSLGDTLGELPGISSTSFGPGAGRPVIRGLDGPRIRVLQNSLGALDASVTSPDHAVAIDPMAAQRIEVIRGAGTLMYGSSAVGGVVNVRDGRVPDAIPEHGAEGDVHGVYGSAADEKSGGGGITAGFDDLAFRASVFARDTHDLEIPGFPVSSEFAAQEGLADRGRKGRVENSDVESHGGTLGGAWIGEEARVGVAYGLLETNYGVPSEPGEEIRIDLVQDRVDVEGDWQHDLFLFEEAQLKVAWADYEHREIEDGDTATKIENEGWEGRLDLIQKEWNGLHGSAGFQFVTRDFESEGDEAFVPPSDLFQWGLFAVEEYHLGPVTLEAGLRFERQEIEARQLDFDEDYNGVSFSVGAGWTPHEDWLLGVSLSRTERLPSPEELLSDGPHLATRGFDIGDPTLDEEVGLTVEATVRKRHGRVRGGLNAFYTDFDDYIFNENTGNRVDETGTAPGELFERRYRQTSAEFYGGEAHLDVEVLEHELFTGIFDVSVDYVRAKARSSDLPRIPPLRLKTGLEARSDYVDARIELADAPPLPRRPRRHDSPAGSQPDGREGAQPRLVPQGSRPAGRPRRAHRHARRLLTHEGDAEVSVPEPGPAGLLGLSMVAPGIRVLRR
jgi:iron complex outermembrane receptor protein